MSYSMPIDRAIQAGYSHPLLRRWQSMGSEITPFNMVYPVFVLDVEGQIRSIDSFPDQFLWSVDKLSELLDPLIDMSLKSIILFGVITDIEKKDVNGTYADRPDGPVIRAIKYIKEKYSDLFVIADVCMCQYTSTGNCGVVKSTDIDNELTIGRLAQIATNYALAGADMVAPSDMTDGRIGAIKDQLMKHHILSRTPILSYSAKFASTLYGPFRDCVGNKPASGNRAKCQLPIGSSKLAIRALLRDCQDGADFLMVKPASLYLDIINEAKKRTNLPIAAFQVSGEYSTIWHASKAGVYDLKAAVLESIHAIRRAGADLVISYYTPNILRWLQEDCHL